jgi:hypothetical protein
MGEYTIDNSVSETVKARHDDEIVVLSLFDGISCAHVGLETAGFTNVTYYASEIDKWASAITRFNYPDTIELGDVCAITRSMLPEHVDLMIGGSPCFTGETLVLTKEGHKEIRDVVVGDYVLTHKRRWRKVTKTGSTPNQRTLNIRGYGNPGINATPNHPFYSRTRYTQWDNSIRSNIRLFNDPIWRSADTLNKTTYLGSVTTPQNMEPSKHDTNFWRMIGRYTGDGWYRKGRRIGRINSYQYALIICCGKHEKDELIEIMDNTGYHYGIVEERT